MENYNEKNNSNPSENSALVGMILGIISVALCWIPIIGLVLAIIALVLAVKGIKASKIINKGRGFSITGICCGSVGIVLNVIYTLIWVFAVFLSIYTYDTINDNVEELDDYENTYNSIYKNYNYEYNSILDDYDI